MSNNIIATMSNTFSPPHLANNPPVPIITPTIQGSDQPSLEHLFVFKYYQYDTQVAYRYRQLTEELDNILKDKIQYLSNSLSNLHNIPDWINYDRCERTRCGSVFQYNDKWFQVIVLHPLEYEDF